jgi:hypothetical protein
VCCVRADALAQLIRLPRPFEVEPAYLREHLDEMVDATFADIRSQFLVLPKGPSLIEYADFEAAYEVLKRQTSAFGEFTEQRVWDALREDSLVFVVLRTILGVTPSEWAALARSERSTDVEQGYVRGVDVQCRRERRFMGGLARPRHAVALARLEALVGVAVDQISKGAPPAAADTVHRLAKVDTSEGLTSLRHAAAQHVPYAVLLYERYLGRPFAAHRDSVSELVGDVMESAIEERLTRAGISFRKTKRAEKVPGYDQNPDFFVPDELAPAALIEAKMAEDDGTARDKATRIVHLAEMRDERLRKGATGFEVIACIDGRGFAVRREDMKRMLLNTSGKVFTLQTLDSLISNTRLREFLPRPK